MSRAREEYKVVLLGEGRVGKTSIISRFVNDSFDEDERSTTQAIMHSVKAVPVGDYASTKGASALSSSTYPSAGPRTVKLAVWDTAGQERFHALAPIYYRNAAGAMLVYDVCDADSLRKVQTWVRELRTVAGDRIRLVVCGNKCDRPASEQEVSPAEALAVAADVGAQHFFTSAKTGLNVAEAFSAMGTAVNEDAVGAMNAGGGTSRRGLGGSGAADTSAAYSAVGRRRRRREVAVDDDGVGDLFTDYGGSSGVGLRTAADYDGMGTGGGSAMRPPRPARPVTLEDMQTSRTQGTLRGEEAEAGGGCC